MKTVMDNGSVSTGFPSSSLRDTLGATSAPDVPVPITPWLQPSPRVSGQLLLKFLTRAFQQDRDTSGSRLLVASATPAGLGGSQRPAAPHGVDLNSDSPWGECPSTSELRGATRTNPCKRWCVAPSIRTGRN